MASLNEVRLIGNLGGDPDLRYTQSGTAVCTLSVATNRRWKDDAGKEHEEVEWHRVVVWKKQAENAAELLKKGDPVFVGGRLQTRSWQDKDGVTKWTTEIVAQSLQFLKPAPKGQRAPHPADANGSQPSSPRSSGDGWDAPDGPPPPGGDDDIPF